jgi:fumarate reductase flavoprotein subunit
LPKRPGVLKTLRTGKRRVIKSDLVVIGGGGSGLAAAVTAAHKGTKVIVLERRARLGGNSIFPKGFFAAESPVQKRAMVDARRDYLFQTAMEWAHWKTDPSIVRAFINKSGDTVRWLEDRGLHFSLVPLFPNQTPLVWHTLKGDGAAIIKVLENECVSLGVEIIFDARAKKIILGKQGKIIGVKAASRKGNLEIAARSIVIATGGYGGNKKLLKKYCPDYHEGMSSRGVPNMGDGLQMAIEIGVATDGLGILQLGGPSVHAKPLKIGTNEDNSFYVPLYAIASEPNTVWVNSKGKRFVNEAVGYIHFVSANAVVRQPGNICYSLFDSSIVKTMSKEGLIVGRGPTKEIQLAGLPGLEGALRSQLDKEIMKITDSWDDIAEWMGTESKMLKETVDIYNTACREHRDSIFVKDHRYLNSLDVPPYYAIKCQADYTTTIGGIKINEDMQVIDNDSYPIKGVYAAGVDAGGWEPDTYCAVLAGSTFGFALNSGRIAGEKAAEYCLKPS